VEGNPPQVFEVINKHELVLFLVCLPFLGCNELALTFRSFQKHLIAFFCSLQAKF
jgi:hypothetical protein